MLAGADGLAVVNVVTLESYLLGVVASEMPSDWKPEALEAQAIAARTYAVATRKPASSPYDLYPDQRSQVYRGLAGEGASSSAAVDATAGQVVLYQGQPIVTYFSSSSGGRTAAVQESLPGVDPEPYLVSVDDPFDTISPYHDWTLSLDDRDLSQKAVYPGLITGVQINAYPSGRVNTVTFNGSAGPLVLSASLVRKRLGLRSTWFTSTPGAPAARTAAIVLHSRVVRDRVLLTGNAPPGAVTLQGGGSPSWRDIATHPVADDGAVSFRRPVGEAARYRLVAGSLSSPAVPVIRHSGLVLRGRPGARLHGRLFPKGALGFVALQHVIGGRWTWVARAKTRADGSLPVHGPRGRRALARALARCRQLPRVALAGAARGPAHAGLDADRPAGGARVEPHGGQRIRLRGHLARAPGGARDGGGDRQRHRSHEPRPRGRGTAGAHRRGPRSDPVADPRHRRGGHHRGRRQQRRGRRRHRRALRQAARLPRGQRRRRRPERRGGGDP